MTRQFVLGLILFNFVSVTTKIFADDQVDGLPDCPKNQQTKEAWDPSKPVMPTIYDDGKSCPSGDCEKDSHVVFDKSMNGTGNAHAPGSAYQPCIKGQNCEICFQNGSSCMTVKYEGSGPKPGRFDFTVGFYMQSCKDRSRLPKELAQECADQSQDLNRFTSGSRTNCIKNPAAPACAAMMEKAISDKADDSVQYDKCMKMKENAFNAQDIPASQKRKYDCAYTNDLHYFRGKDKNGNACKKSWYMLEPGACGKGFASPKGLDCCTGDPTHDGLLGQDCLAFYPTGGQSAPVVTTATVAPQPKPATQSAPRPASVWDNVPVPTYQPATSFTVH